jgi:hypothetical protein
LADKPDETWKHDRYGHQGDVHGHERIGDRLNGTAVSQYTLERKNRGRHIDHKKKLPVYR